MELQTHFYEAFKAYPSDKKIKEFWEQLLTHYSESFRTYHNLEHLKELFSLYDQHQKLLKYPGDVSIAIFYHDSIYNIWKKDNETKSALLAKEVLTSIQYPSTNIERIENLILVTKDHKASTNDEAYMVDFDLSILGQHPEIYQSYTQKIRKEYISIPTPIYRNGRKKVLKHFLKKETIYQTPLFQEKLELQARTNLHHELEKL